MSTRVGDGGEDGQTPRGRAFGDLARGIEGGPVTGAVEGAVLLRFEFAIPMRAERREGAELAAAADDKEPRARYWE